MIRILVDLVEFATMMLKEYPIASVRINALYPIPRRNMFAEAMDDSISTNANCKKKLAAVSKRFKLNRGKSVPKREQFYPVMETVHLLTR